MRGIVKVVEKATGFFNNLLDSDLLALVRDLSDRKMVAAAHALAQQTGDETIANASDTDWYDWENGLKACGISIEQILPEWSLPKYLEKQKR
ncbi:MAG: hypothetical protein A2087_13890 [Spirochaetes bacterium GWD1_61_31]|nr:MAG: hypothetical protein A2Y37_04895 [Spirochaetes bacterium GWB1_60_80]OHD29119.1 MAG: hypothetical protein A2004_10625 [Spirochaetes bacterium GWC1_61_12]OHD41875.1 MAG: hypothetical protein A2087_13890 [Spirochaetes bacterium GWD1_61_31]OHD60197.1 MAG: hypothetical protein A2Y32_07135 [Spirochaetes bacterium GWF1_60_12]HAW84695.1 hypothetical protein [Spirochaetaceae bacterium]